jgi:stearoyl-CoA desaturase (Delta-9 desaturase)
MKKLIQAVNWPGALFLLLTPPIAIVLTIYHLRTEGFVWQIWVLFAVMYTLSIGSIAGGYHRLFAHRTYEARPWLRVFYAFFGAATFQNSIYVWARDHRVHHRFVDTDLDPYSINKGFWFAHIGWMLTSQAVPVKMEPYGRDLEKDPIVMFQHKHYMLLATIAGLGVPTLIGYFMGSWLGGLAIGGFVRIVVGHHMTFFINSWCHYFGGQTYTNDNTARDSFFMAVATFGEGYHNFHHIFADDYRNGVRWYHWDPTKWMIQTFRVFGLAHSLKRAPQSEITRLQLEMEEKHLKNHLSNNWQVQFQTQLDSLKVQIQAAQQRFEQLRAEYKQMANEYAQSKIDRLEELKFQIRMAKIEFRAGLQQWRAYNSFLLAAVPVNSYRG